MSHVAGASCLAVKPLQESIMGSCLCEVRQNPMAAFVEGFYSFAYQQLILVCRRSSRKACMLQKSCAGFYSEWFVCQSAKASATDLVQNFSHFQRSQVNQILYPKDNSRLVQGVTYLFCICHRGCCATTDTDSLLISEAMPMY